MKKFISYYRVSTARQGVSGLGLEAQKASVLSFIGQDNSRSSLIAEFTDVEHGSNNYRPQLLKALEQCKKHDATLIIAKLDRLSRNVTFISTLMDNKVKFICCDIPDATELTIHIFASMAQKERKDISHRTKVSLNALKERGVKLGNPYRAGDIKKDGTIAKEALGHDAREAGIAAIKKKAAENPQNKQASLVIGLLFQQGKTLATIAQELNKAGMTTATGKEFRPEQVRRLLPARN